jgi:hypothetical protein
VAEWGRELTLKKLKLKVKEREEAKLKEEEMKRKEMDERDVGGKCSSFVVLLCPGMRF